MKKTNTKSEKSAMAPTTEKPKNRWLASRVEFDAELYDAGFAAQASSGKDIHGEATFVLGLNPFPHTVLDAGCGTGRVALELVKHGLVATGVDIDARMIERARQKAPELSWYLEDLATVKINQKFDLVVLAGNVMIYLTPGTEAQVVANLAGHLKSGGYLVAGFHLGSVLSLADYDKATQAAGLVLVERWAAWERDPWLPASDYAVSVHRYTV